MPSTNPVGSNRGRLFVRAQLPLLVCSVFVVALVALFEPAALAYVEVGIGFGVIVLASLTLLVFPWERLADEWLLILAVMDIVGVAIVRDVLLPFVTPIGLLSVFPVMWIVYGFARRFVVIAIAGALFISGYPFLSQWELPAHGEWVTILALPLIVIGIAFAVSIAGAQLRRSRASALRARDKAEDSLLRVRDSEILLRSILDTVNAAVAFYGPDRRLIMANQLAHDTVHSAGFELDAVPYAGPNVLQADRITPIPLEDQIIPRALRGDLIADHLEWLGEPSNQIAILATSRQIFRGTDDDLLGTLVVAYDVTELAEAVMVREEFVITVSHELRTPLTSIIGYLEVIEDEIDTHSLGLARYFEIINRNSQELQRRVSELLTLSDKTLELTKEAVSVDMLVGEVLDQFLPSAATKNLTLERDIPDATMAEIDPGAYRQVVQNLLSNAIKYTPQNGVISVELQIVDGLVELCVSDTGIGMTAMELQHAFDRFYRAAAARTGAIQGFGVGLSLVRDIVDAHGGNITADSERGKGTRITVRVPQTPAVHA